MDHGGQPEVGRRQAEDGQRPPHVVAGRILADRRVDAHRHGDHQPDDDRHQAELNGHRQPLGDALLHGVAARQ